MSNFVYIDTDGLEKAKPLKPTDMPIHNSRIEVDADYTNFSAPLEIGILSSISRIDKIVVDIIEEFDEGSITVGDDDAQGRLVTADQVDLLHVNIYVIENFLKYDTDTTAKIYFTGTPTQGRLRVIIFYQ